MRNQHEVYPNIKMKNNLTFFLSNPIIHCQNKINFHIIKSNEELIFHQMLCPILGLLRKSWNIFAGFSLITWLMQCCRTDNNSLVQTIQSLISRWTCICIPTWPVDGLALSRKGRCYDKIARQCLFQKCSLPLCLRRTILRFDQGQTIRCHTWHLLVEFTLFYRFD